MNSEPHWYVLGAGALGTALSWQLQEAGLPCTLLHHHAGTSTRTLRFEGGEYSIPVHPVSTLEAKPAERVIITTKAGAVNDALALIAPHLATDALVLCTANGLGFDADSNMLKGPLLRAVTTAGAFRDGDDVALVSTGRTVLGNPGVPSAEPPWFQGSLGRLDTWHWREDIATALGEKFSINCVINPLTAVQRCRNEELLLDDGPGPALTALCKETEPLLRELGLWGSTSLLEQAVQVCRSTAANRSSMLQDVLALRPTEIAYLNGELLRRAGDTVLPLNSALVHTLSLGR